MRVQLANEIFRVPAYGYMTPVHTASLPWSEATQRVQSANAERSIRRDLEYKGGSPVSKMEIALLAGLLYYDLAPECQAPIGPFDADFLFPHPRLVIEVDGKEWHEKERDNVRDAIMRREGYEIMRFKGTVVYKDPLRCARDVLQWLLLPAAA